MPPISCMGRPAWLKGDYSLHAGSDRLFVRVHDAVIHCTALGISSAGANGAAAMNGSAEHTVLSMPLLATDPLLE